MQEDIDELSETEKKDPVLFIFSIMEDTKSSARQRENAKRRVEEVKQLNGCQEADGSG